MFTLGILHTTIRAEEKLLIAACQKQGVKVELVDIRTTILNPHEYQPNFSVALERCVSTVKGTYATKFLESTGVKVINTSQVAGICEDKFLTSLTLTKHKVPTPKFALVFGITEAEKAVEQLGGFPVVLKPNLGSWGRLLAKINDIDALEAIIEHKDVLGSPQQKAIYLQQYIDKPGRDIRIFVINHQPICAIYRDSPHWITNTARGAKTANCPITKDLEQLAKKASQAIGGGILAMDIFETNEGLTINEINHTMEFRNSEAPTGVSISDAMIEYCKQIYSSSEGGTTESRSGI